MNKLDKVIPYYSEINSFLVAQSPELIYSFYRDSSAHGYLIYFKEDCFSFFRPCFQNEFPLFNVLHTNLFKFNHDTCQQLTPHFEEVFATIYNAKIRTNG